MFKNLFRRAQPPVLYRREKPIRWTKADAQAFRAFVESESGVKLLAFQDDAMIRALIERSFTPEQVGAWKRGLGYMLSFKGQEDELPAVDGQLAPIQFADDESEK